MGAGESRTRGARDSRGCPCLHSHATVLSARIRIRTAYLRLILAFVAVLCFRFPQVKKQTPFSNTINGIGARLTEIIISDCFFVFVVTLKMPAACGGSNFCTFE